MENRARPARSSVTTSSSDFAMTNKLSGHEEKEKEKKKKKKKRIKQSRAINFGAQRRSRSPRAARRFGDHYVTLIHIPMLLLLILPQLVPLLNRPICNAKQQQRLQETTQPNTPMFADWSAPMNSLGAQPRIARTETTSRQVANDELDHVSDPASSSSALGSRLDEAQVNERNQAADSRQTSDLRMENSGESLWRGLATHTEEEEEEEKEVEPGRAPRTFKRIVSAGAPVRLACPHLVEANKRAAQRSQQRGHNNSRQLWPPLQQTSTTANNLSATTNQSSYVTAKKTFPFDKETRKQIKGPQRVAAVSDSQKQQIKWFRNHVPLNLNYDATTMVETTTAAAGGRATVLEALDELGQDLGRSKSEEFRQTPELASLEGRRRWFVDSFGELVIPKMTLHSAGKYSCLAGGQQSELLLAVLDAVDNDESSSGDSSSLALENNDLQLQQQQRASSGQPTSSTRADIDKEPRFVEEEGSASRKNSSLSRAARSNILTHEDNDDDMGGQKHYQAAQISGETGGPGNGEIRDAYFGEPVAVGLVGKLALQSVAQQRRQDKLISEEASEKQKSREKKRRRRKRGERRGQDAKEEEEVAKEIELSPKRPEEQQQQHQGDGSYFFGEEEKEKRVSSQGLSDRTVLSFNTTTVWNKQLEGWQTNEPSGIFSQPQAERSRGEGGAAMSEEEERAGLEGRGPEELRADNYAGSSSIGASSSSGNKDSINDDELEFNLLPPTAGGQATNRQRQRQQTSLGKLQTPPPPPRRSLLVVSAQSRKLAHLVESETISSADLSSIPGLLYTKQQFYCPLQLSSFSSNGGGGESSSLLVDMLREQISVFAGQFCATQQAVASRESLGAPPGSGSGMGDRSDQERPQNEMEECQRLVARLLVLLIKNERNCAGQQEAATRGQAALRYDDDNNTYNKSSFASDDCLTTTTTATRARPKISKQLLSTSASFLNVIWLKDNRQLHIEESASAGPGLASRRASLERPNLKLIDSLADDGQWTSSGARERKEPGQDNGLAAASRGCRDKAGATNWNRLSGLRDDCIGAGQQMGEPAEVKALRRDLVLEIDGLRRDDAGRYSCALKLNSKKLWQIFLRLRHQGSYLRQQQQQQQQQPSDKATNCLYDNDKSLCCDQSYSSREQLLMDASSPPQRHQQLEQEQRDSSSNSLKRQQQQQPEQTTLAQDLELALSRGPAQLDGQTFGRLNETFVSTLNSVPATKVQTFVLIVIERPANSCSIWSTIERANEAFGRRTLANFKRLKQLHGSTNRLASSQNEINSSADDDDDGGQWLPFDESKSTTSSERASSNDHNDNLRDNHLWPAQDEIKFVSTRIGVVNDDEARRSRVRGRRSVQEFSGKEKDSRHGRTVEEHPHGGANLLLNNAEEAKDSASQIDHHHQQHWTKRVDWPNRRQMGQEQVQTIAGPSGSRPNATSGPRTRQTPDAATNKKRTPVSEPIETSGPFNYANERNLRPPSGANDSSARRAAETSSDPSLQVQAAAADPGKRRRRTTKRESAPKTSEKDVSEARGGAGAGGLANSRALHFIMNAHESATSSPRGGRPPEGAEGAIRFALSSANRNDYSGPTIRQSRDWPASKSEPEDLITAKNHAGPTDSLRINIIRPPELSSSARAGMKLRLRRSAWRSSDWPTLSSDSSKLFTGPMETGQESTQYLVATKTTTQQQQQQQQQQQKQQQQQQQQQQQAQTLAEPTLGRPDRRESVMDDSQWPDIRLASNGEQATNLATARGGVIDGEQEKRPNDWQELAVQGGLGGDLSVDAAKAAELVSEPSWRGRFFTSSKDPNEHESTLDQDRSEEQEVKEESSGQIKSPPPPPPPPIGYEGAAARPQLASSLIGGHKLRPQQRLKTRYSQPQRANAEADIKPASRVMAMRRHSLSSAEISSDKLTQVYAGSAGRRSESIQEVASVTPIGSSSENIASPAASQADDDAATDDYYYDNNNNNNNSRWDGTDSIAQERQSSGQQQVNSGHHQTQNDDEDEDNESLLWKASQYVYMHVRAQAASSIYGVQVDVEWSNERVNGTNTNLDQPQLQLQPADQRQARSPGQDSPARRRTEAGKPLPSPNTPLESFEPHVGITPFATIDLVPGQNLHLQCTAQALGRLPEVKWYKHIERLPRHLSGTSLATSLTRRIGTGQLFWPLTESGLLEDEENQSSNDDVKEKTQSKDNASKSGPDGFVYSRSTTIFDNLLNQTFTVVSSLQLSPYTGHRADLFSSQAPVDESAKVASRPTAGHSMMDERQNSAGTEFSPLNGQQSPTTTRRVLQRHQRNTATVRHDENVEGQSSLSSLSGGNHQHFKLYACIVDADVRHNYAMLGVNYRQAAPKRRPPMFETSFANEPHYYNDELHEIGPEAAHKTTSTTTTTIDDKAKDKAIGLTAKVDNNKNNKEPGLVIAMPRFHRALFPAGENEASKFSYMRHSQMMLPFRSLWKDRAYGVAANRSQAISLSGDEDFMFNEGTFPVSPLMISMVIGFVFSSLLALVYLTLRSYQALTNYNNMINSSQFEDFKEGRDTSDELELTAAQAAREADGQAEKLRPVSMMVKMADSGTGELITSVIDLGQEEIETNLDDNIPITTTITDQQDRASQGWSVAEQQSIAGQEVGSSLMSSTPDYGRGLEQSSYHTDCSNDYGSSQTSSAPTLVQRPHQPLYEALYHPTFDYSDVLESQAIQLMSSIDHGHTDCVDFYPAVEPTATTTTSMTRATDELQLMSDCACCPLDSATDRMASYHQYHTAIAIDASTTNTTNYQMNPDCVGADKLMSHT